MTRVLIFLLILLTAIFAFAHFLRRTGMFFPDQYPVGRWERSAFLIEPSEHTFITSDGVKLHAWRFDAKDPDAPVMIWFHGNAGNLTDRADMAVEHAKRGISVFVFDYRGYGKSEGKASESKLFLDSLASFDYVRNKGAKKIVLYGESVGGPYAAYVAKERKGSVRAVILENSFPSLKDMGNALYRPLPLGWTAPFALRTTAWLNDAGVPVLVMHGTRDAVIPYSLGEKLYDGLRVRKEMLTSHAGHCEIPIFEPARYYETVTRFVHKETA
ncbi:MAG TPA: alpha/beta fold hydrolase [Thermoanaerobaculia bacterium]|nr:alpha/beta fold hydrolase [Thermoanaerobaculia bacterium]